MPSKPSLTHSLYNTINVSRKNNELINKANGRAKPSENKKGMLNIITQIGEVVPGVGSPILNW